MSGFVRRLRSAGVRCCWAHIVKYVYQIVLSIHTTSRCLFFVLSAPETTTLGTISCLRQIGHMTLDLLPEVMYGEVCGAWIPKDASFHDLVRVYNSHSVFTVLCTQWDLIACHSNLGSGATLKLVPTQCRDYYPTLRYYPAYARIIASNAHSPKPRVHERFTTIITKHKWGKTRVARDFPTYILKGTGLIVLPVT